MPIFDFHSHLNPADIYHNTRFHNLTQAWLRPDHYKWRAMRANGIPEERITGNASDYEKFEAWAETLPYCAGNPLSHWSHLELARYFNIEDRLLSKENAKGIFDRCNELLVTDEYRTRKLIEMMNVRLICTTDDPVDSLACHIKLND